MPAPDLSGRQGNDLVGPDLKLVASAVTAVEASQSATTDALAAKADTTALDAKAPKASPTFTGTVAGVTKAHVGLSNVDNTADSAKPVSAAQQTALNAKATAAGLRYEYLWNGTAYVAPGGAAIATRPANTLRGFTGSTDPDALGLMVDGDRWTDTTA